ncbi:ABC transporter ATP-binding protein [Rubritalea profundi]|uniref:ABC transporter ATP-binding protein n=1 Tax=Rubritalea profundi TaxID=1658618 RepID=A0A2S7U6J4_9BACT|nr:ATP-binding cassette domain-containing protein [Rubritalea profundi]PQJ30170.1 ABC transporter ATP-binding protein [Rubritalea profundi]
MLTVQQLSIKSGSFELNSISFDVPTGACVALMGTSGSGKTTIMEAICGLRQITAGKIMLDGRDITKLPPGARHVALVPQDNVLFPHLSVRDHLAFGPSIQKWSSADTKLRVEELAESLGITHLLDRGPDKLSGGESKRVALGRALATRPSLLCLDEALTGLDDDTHAEILDVIKSHISKENITTLHITHSLREAEELADQVIQMAELRSN